METVSYLYKELNQKEAEKQIGEERKQTKEETRKTDSRSYMDRVKGKKTDDTRRNQPTGRQ